MFLAPYFLIPYYVLFSFIFYYFFQLDLSSNKLVNLTLKAFEGLKELVTLQLSNNSIKNIDNEAFQELGNSLYSLNIVCFVFKIKK